jgi:ABC-type multidrug transport system ATPase subunit
MIDLAGVCFAYEAGAVVLDGVDLHLEDGLTLLVGPNGCGKSTLLRAIAGVERPDRGTVTVHGRDLWTDEVEARRPLAYVPEHPDLSPYASLLEVLRLVCRLRGEPIDRARSALAEAGLLERAQASVRELSAGQRRRALLAAAWVGAPRVVLLDEPLESLDRGLQERVLAWIARLVESHATVVVVSHQLEPFAGMAAAAITVKDGKAIGPVALPADASSRMALLERLARGEDLAATWPSP